MNLSYNGRMKDSRSTGKAALAADAWRLMFDFLNATAPQRHGPLAKHGLTPNDSKALHALDPRVGRTMGSLAAEWICDASNATWIVDRLEKQGLAERRPAPADRRVKLVVLTPKGRRIREELMAELYRPPPEFLALREKDLQALRDALEPVRRAASPSQDRSEAAR